jgi:hypothetical protein
VHVVILERNKLVARKVSRLFLSVGATVQMTEDPAALDVSLADVICADTFDADLVAERVRGKPGLRGILWTAEPIKRSLRHMLETTAIDHVLGRKDFETAPRSWEVLMVARRFIGTHALPIGAFLDWGHQAFELAVHSTHDRDLAVAAMQQFATSLQLPKRLVEMFGELGHELIMNALYDAPVDATGKPKYAGDRKVEVHLTDAEKPTIRVGTDGTSLVIQVKDPFGRLQRHHVFDGLARGLAGGEIDRSHGGAGLGMMVCHNNSGAMFFDVVAGKQTEVTALVELDMNLRELRTQAKSLHFWSR